MPVILPDDDQGMGDKDNNNMNGHHHHDGMDHQTMDHDQHPSSHSHSSMHNGMMSQGTIMYMDGFRSALFPSSSQPLPPCLNLFHPSWTLSSSGIFVFAMVCVTLIGVLVEVCGVWRVKCLRRGRSCRREAKLRQLRQWEEQQQQQPQHESILRGHPSGGVYNGGSGTSGVSLEGNTGLLPSLMNETSPAIIFHRIRRSIRTQMRCCFPQNTTNDDTQARMYDIGAALLHAARAALGYLLMLAVMSYAVEFLICAVLGMVLGRYLSAGTEGSNSVVGGAASGTFDNAVGRENGGQGAGMANLNIDGNSSDEWGGGDPCCGIDDNESDDINHNDGLVSDSMIQDPLRSPLMENYVGGVTRRSGASK